MGLKEYFAHLPHHQHRWKKSIEPSLSDHTFGAKQTDFTGRPSAACTRTTTLKHGNYKSEGHTARRAAAVQPLEVYSNRNSEGCAYRFQLNVLFSRQYVYDPSQTPQQPGGPVPQQGTSYPQQTRAMMPPPMPVAHGKSNGASPSVGAIDGVSHYARGQLPPGDVSQAQQQLLPDNSFVPVGANRSAPLTSNRFTPRASTSHMPLGLSSRFVPQTSESRRFVPQTPDTRRFAPAGTAAGSRNHSRAGNPNPIAHNGQRGPFYPGTRMG